MAFSMSSKGFALAFLLVFAVSIAATATPFLAKASGASKKLEVQVQVEGEHAALKVQVKVKGAPQGSFDVILNEGVQQTTLGQLVVEGTGSGQAIFIVSATPGTHTVTVTIDFTLALTAGPFTVTVLPQDV